MPFVGRQSEVISTREALETFRLVTLFGLPGCGKTALAMEALRGRDEFEVHRCRPTDGAEVLDGLSQHSVVLLDDADQLGHDALQRLEALAATGDTTWLTTARRRLGIAGEAVRHVSSLAAAEAVLLLDHLLLLRDVRCDRARLAAAARRVEGHAFGLCAAAQRIEVVGIDTFLQDDRFDAVERLFDAELARASETELCALAACGLFAEPFSAAAFEVISDQPLQTLTALVDHAFVERTSSPPRFRMSRTLAKVAAARESTVDAMERHARWALADGTRAELLLVAERAACDELPPALGVDAVVVLTSGPQPPKPLVEWALGEARGVDHPALPDLLCVRAHIAIRDSDMPLAALLLDEAQLVASTDAQAAALHEARAALARITATPEDALREYAKALELRAADAPPELLLNHAAALWECGAHAEAREATRIALEQATVAGDVRREGVITSNLGVMAHNAGEFAEARVLHDRALDLHRDSGHRRFEGITLFDLATLDHEGGHLTRAGARYQEAIAILDEVGDQRLGRLARAAATSAACQAGAPTDWDLRAIREAFDRDGDATYSEAVGLYEQLRDHCRSASPDAFDASGYTRRSDEVQIPARLLAKLTRAMCDEMALVVAADRGSFQLGGRVVDLQTRDAYRNIFRLFVDSRLRGDPPIELAALVECGWPGEVVEPTAAKNRAHVALNALRNLGLRSAIQTVDGGYTLSDITIVIAIANV